MKFQLSFSCDNAAFWNDDMTEFDFDETSRILRRVAFSVEEHKTEGIVRDFNGNTVGAWYLLEEEN